MHRGLQASVIAALGASPREIEELLGYNENVFDLASLGPATRFPLPDEPFVAFWEMIVEEAPERGAFAVLCDFLPQLRFPIQEGISATEAYRAATRKGISPDALPQATGLELQHSEEMEVVLYASAAGRIPLLIIRQRDDFTALVRALAKRNEPAPVPSSQGALMVSGYNNWSRIQGLRRRWEALNPSERETATWSEELARIIPHRELYQDRFILLSDGPYSGVPASDLGLAAATWRDMSLRIRREHECTHYFTRRLFGSMRNNLLDELIADFMGITAALGRFRADWCLQFLGARLDIYRGEPPLSDGAFRVLQALVKAAAENLERSAQRLTDRLETSSDNAAWIAALASLRLEDLAGPDAEKLVARAFDRVHERIDPASARSTQPPY